MQKINCWTATGKISVFNSFPGDSIDLSTQGLELQRLQMKTTFSVNKYIHS